MERITAEYIIEQIGNISNEDLLQLIEDFGEQQYDQGVDNASYD